MIEVKERSKHAAKVPNNGHDRKKPAFLVDPFTFVNRGPIQANVRYMPGPSADTEYVYVELIAGQRKARTPFTGTDNHAEMVADLLVMLGFSPKVTEGQGLWYDETGNVGADDDSDE